MAAGRAGSPADGHDRPGGGHAQGEDARHGRPRQSPLVAGAARHDQGAPGPAADYSLLGPGRRTSQERPGGAGDGARPAGATGPEQGEQDHQGQKHPGGARSPGQVHRS